MMSRIRPATTPNSVSQGMWAPRPGGPRRGGRGMRMLAVAATLAVALSLAASPSVSYAAPCCNTNVGTNSMHFNTTGDYDTAFGYEALDNGTTGTNNTAVGYDALLTQTTGPNGGDNTGVGSDALRDDTTGGFNSAFGALALYFNTSG